MEAQRLEQRTNYDLEMMQEVGYCSGIENYSRHMSNRKPGEPPFTLLDYFPKDFLIMIDESHVTVPQLRAMYNGDQSRKRPWWTMASAFQVHWITDRLLLMNSQKESIRLFMYRQHPVLMKWGFRQIWRSRS